MRTTHFMHARHEPRILDLKAVLARRRRIERVTERKPPPPPSEPPRSSLARRLLVGAAVVLGFVLVTATWYWHATESRRALRALPAQDRVALCQRTIASLREVCEPAPPRSLRAFCRDQAELVLNLDECDAGCQELARRNLAIAGR